MKWYLSAEIEAETLEQAWFIATNELPTGFSEADWWSRNVTEFSLSANNTHVAGARTHVRGVRE